ncbi:MAG: hypothetical protein IH851_04650 [Armatimonadetes bacterium]|nr:hypothetical protein [Armatimonadota bacterium]
MIQMYDDLHSQGLEIVGVTKYYGWYGTEYRDKRDMPKDDEFARMKEFMVEHSLPWPVLFGDPANFDDYGVTGIPHVTVIDREGNVHTIEIGYRAENFAEFRKEVEALLAR